MTKIQLRNLWFQVHKWIGLILAIAIIPLCLTGSALVWGDALERMAYPERYAVGGPAALPAERYAAAAGGVLRPGERLSRLTIPAEAGEPVEASAVRAARGGGRPERITVYLDPADARVIERHEANSGIFQILHVIHGSLMIPGGWGRAIVGWIGVAMLVSSMTGLWLWWPVTGSVRRGLRWKRQPGTDANLHHLLGFWISVPLFVLSLTGVWISFPAVFSVFDAASRAPGRGPDRAAMMRALPIEAPTTPIATAIAQARAAAPGDVRTLGWPTDLKREWYVDLASGRARARVTVNDATGEAKAGPSRPGGPPHGIARTMRQVHDGHDMPLWWQVIVFLGGLLPAILAITGIIMWWRARGWRADLARRQGEANARREAQAAREG